MARLGRTARLLAWIAVIAAVLSACALARLDITHSRGVAALGVLLCLSMMLWLLATTPGDALRLPPLASEVLVLAATVVLILIATGRLGFSPAAAAITVLAGHVRERPANLWPRWRAQPWFGNTWRLAPALWHPALWLTAPYPLRSALTWAGVGLCAAAGIGAVLATSRGFWARSAGLAIWVVAGAITLRPLW